MNSPNQRVDNQEAITDHVPFQLLEERQGGLRQSILSTNKGDSVYNDTGVPCLAYKVHT
jgi:hypothetical protein